MKKTLIITGAILIFLFVFLLAVPVVFKKALLEKIKDTINRNIMATVEFSDFKLSLIRKFPKATLELKNIVVTGKDDFSGDTLVSIPLFRSSMQLFSLFRSGEKSIGEIEIIGPDLNLLVNSEGKANWDIIPAGDTTHVSQPAGESAFSLQLSKVVIKDADILYSDESTGMDLVFRNANLNVSGKMFGSMTDLQAKVKTDEFSIIYDSVTYLSKTSLETNSLLRIDYEKMDISILENELLVNRLPLEVTGDIKMPGDSIWFDLAFTSKTSDFTDFLDLVPPDYEHYLTGLTTSGSASLSGIFKGFYYDEEYPFTDVALKVSEGRLKYDGLPEEIRNIKADVKISKPQGNLNSMILHIKEAHAEVRNNPVNLTFLLSHITSDPYFDGALVGKVNFDQLKDALPLDSVNLSGTIDANLFVKGNYSSIENEEFDKVGVDGIVLLDNFVFSDPGLTQQVLIPVGNLDFSPVSVNLKELNMKIGDSDFRMAGTVSNYLNYIFKDGTLKGSLNLNSSFVNINQLVNLQRKKAGVQSASETIKPVSQNADEEKITAFDVPGRVDFEFRSDIDRALFDRLPLTNINGLIHVKDGRLNLDGLHMTMLEGEMNLNGSYQNTSANKPLFEFGFDILNFDIPVAFQSLTSVQNMFPVAGNTSGRLSTSFKMQGQFSPDMKLIPSSVSGIGQFLTRGIHIIDSPVFDQIRGVLKKDKLKDIEIEDFTANFDIQDGNLILKPFNTRVAGQETTVYGKLNPENIIDMKLDFLVERKAFGQEIQAVLGILPGQDKITEVPATVVISGPVNNPVVRLDLSQARQNITNEVKKSTKEELQKTLDKIGKGLKKLIK